ncbi:MAG: radical SAM protein [bacterium]
MNSNYQYYKTTRSLCPLCGHIVPAKIVFIDDTVYMIKICTEHGEFQSLIYRGKEEYCESLKINKPAVFPLTTFIKDFKGCALSCGLCIEHQQHTCLPIIEITNHCNMSCPICLAHNHGDFYMSPERFKKIVDHLIEAEGRFDLINLSGGEPTLHPNLIEIIDIARRSEIVTITISTNGRIFLNDEELLVKLIDRGIFISLQFDGFNDNTYRVLRGEDLVQEKLQVLELLERYSASASLVMTVMNGINNNEIGKVMEYFLKKDFLKSIMFQPIVFTNPRLEYDISKVITISDIAKEIAHGTNGVIKETDIINLPCSHPLCFALTYLLKLDNGEYLPIPGIVPVDKYLDLIKNKAMPGLESESYETIKEHIYSLWSSSGIHPENKKVLKVIKNILCELGKHENGYDPNQLFELGQRHIKSVFIHHFMDRYNFDFSRVMKCCNHYPIEEERLIPCCVYNTLMR